MSVNRNLLDVAKSNISCRYGIDERSLVYRCVWGLDYEQLISFQVKQPGHPYNGSTLSFKIPDEELP